MRVPLRPERRLGGPVAAEVGCHAADVVPKRALDLPVPAEVAEPPAGEEQVRRAIRLDRLRAGHEQPAASPPGVKRRKTLDYWRGHNRAWRACGPDRSVGLGVDGAVFGRDGELDDGRDFLAAEQARGLLIEGVAGIGKKAVWRALLETARSG